MDESTSYYDMPANGMEDVVDGENPEDIFGEEDEEAPAGMETTTMMDGHHTTTATTTDEFFDASPTDMDENGMISHNGSGGGDGGNEQEGASMHLKSDGGGDDDDGRGTAADLLGNQPKSDSNHTSPPQTNGYKSTSKKNGTTLHPEEESEGHGSRGKNSGFGGGTNVEDTELIKETAATLDQCLDRTRAWTKKLLREITMYVGMLESSRSEYTRVQELEHKESDRLDQVEPDVQGATSQVLGNRFMRNVAPGSKRPHP